MSRTAILVTAPSLAGRATAMIKEAGFEAAFSDANATEQELVEFARDVNARTPIVGIISRTIRLGPSIMDALPELAVITKHGAGVDNIDQEAAKERGIGVLRANGVNARSVAELALGLTIATSRNVMLHGNATAAGEWDRARWKGEELEGKTLGLLGFGYIGRLFANLAKPLFHEVIVSDPGVTSEVIAETGAVAVTQDELFERADVLSLHCPLIEQTRGIINAHTLAQMPKGAIIVNTARGELVDEAALLEALDAGHVYAAALDAHAVERPNEDQMLRRHPRVIAMPHVGGSTRQALEKLAEISVENTLGYFGGRSISPVDTVFMPDTRRTLPGS